MTKRILFYASILLLASSCNKHKNETLIYSNNFETADEWQIEYGNTSCLADIDTNLLHLETFASDPFSTDYVNVRLPLSPSTSTKVCYRIHLDNFAFSGYEIDNLNSATAFSGGGTNRIIIQIGDLAIYSVHRSEDEAFSIIDDYIDIEVNTKRNKLKVYQGDKRENISSLFVLQKNDLNDDFIEFGCSSYSIPSLNYLGAQSLRVKSFEIFNL